MTATIAPPEPETSVETPAPPVDRPDDVAMRLVGQWIGILAVVGLSFLVHIGLIGAVQHERDQAALHEQLRSELALATAPVGPTDVDGRPLVSGDPVALLEIPSLGVVEVVGEGTSAGVLMSGPGHRRDTVLPGQAGVSVIAGRRAAYGGPFASIGLLRGGDQIVVTTGQGRHVYRVLGVRRAGDPLPAALAAGKGRLTLMTADGPPFLPTDVVRVDAQLITPAQQAPARLPSDALPAAEETLATDSSALVPLVLWAQLLLAAAVALVWVRHRVGGWQSWVIGLPVLIAIGAQVADQAAAALLPNLL
ncbi:class E sortase [Actinophytocola sp.]|uniref:class E sortase n=1 Tax=Actinophytocola sp. TaxID=1872138 RepID=UPI002ED5758F